MVGTGRVAGSLVPEIQKWSCRVLVVVDDSVVLDVVGERKGKGGFMTAEASFKILRTSVHATLQPPIWTVAPALCFGEDCGEWLRPAPPFFTL